MKLIVVATDERIARARGPERHSVRLADVTESFARVLAGSSSRN